MTKQEAITLLREIEEVFGDAEIAYLNIYESEHTPGSWGVVMQFDSQADWRITKQRISAMRRTK